MIKNVWLEMAMEKTAKVEFERCAKDFSYFAKNYFKFSHPNNGMMPLAMHPFHERLIDHYESYRFSLVPKFRGSAFSTYTIGFMLWKAMFSLDQRIMFLSQTDRSAIELGKICQIFIDNLPKWMKPKMSKANNHRKMFDETNCSIYFHAPQAACGKALNWIVIDEAAFISDLSTHWKAMWPTLSTGGNCIAVSTVGNKWDDKRKTQKNLFYDWHCRAFHGSNRFSIFNSHYKEHPDYADQVLCNTLRSQLGETGWKQEFEMEFLD